MKMDAKLQPHGCALLVLLFAGVQVSAATVNYNVLNFKSNVGSFKIQQGEDLAHGTVEFTFSGTVLVSGLAKGATVVTSPGVLREYNNPKYQKQVYHGKPGKITIKGSFSAIQFFGTNVAGRFEGYGLFRPYGEFDRNLNTGEYWYDGDQHQDWGTGGPTVTVPGRPRGVYTPPKPRVKQEAPGKP